MFAIDGRKGSAARRERRAPSFLLVCAFLAGAVTTCLPTVAAPEAAAGAAPAAARETGSLAEGVCSMLHEIEPDDDGDLLHGMVDWLDGGGVPWDKIGTFTFLTLVDHAACTVAEDQVAERLRRLLPHPDTLPTGLFGGPGGVVAPVVIASTDWTQVNPNRYQVTLQLSWLATGNTPESGVDVALVVNGQVTSPYQHLTTVDDVPGAPGTVVLDDTLVLGTSYQEAVRVDDALGTSPWTCSEPFKVKPDPDPTLRFQAKPATTLAATCPA